MVRHSRLDPQSAAMRPALALILLLVGCARAVPVFPVCPPPVPVPASVPRVRTQAQMNQLEVAVELAREAERHRGDACADAAAARDAWISGGKTEKSR